MDAFTFSLFLHNCNLKGGESIKELCTGFHRTGNPSDKTGPVLQQNRATCWKKLSHKLRWRHDRNKQIFEPDRGHPTRFYHAGLISCEDGLKKSAFSLKRSEGGSNNLMCQNHEIYRKIVIIASWLIFWKSYVARVTQPVQHNILFNGTRHLIYRTLNSHQYSILHTIKYLQTSENLLQPYGPTCLPQ